MSKFKLGDKVRRTGSTLECIAQFNTLTVNCLEHNGRWLGVAEYTSPSRDRTPFLASKFELVQAVSEQPAVLTPLEVAEAMLTGTELQFKRHGSDVWRDLPLRKNVVHFSTSNEYRKKPTTVLINGISVPAPAVVYNPSIMFYIDLRRLCVQHIPTRCIKADSKGLYWCTKEAAREALDAIMTSFTK